MQQGNYTAMSDLSCLTMSTDSLRWLNDEFLLGL